QRSTGEGVSQNGDRHGGGKSRRFIEASRHCCPHEQPKHKEYRAECDRNVNPIDQIELERAALLSGTLHRGYFFGNEVADDSVGVRDLIMHAVSACDLPELSCGSRERGFELQQRILLEAIQDDQAHFLAEAVEAAKLIEHAPAPQELIGSGRQLVAIRTQLEPRVWAMVVEIALDDSILQHAAESNPEAARRPGQLPRKSKVCREQHRRAGRECPASGKKHRHTPTIRRQQAKNGKPQNNDEYCKRRAVAGGGKGGQKKQADSLAAPEIRLMIDQQIECKHAYAGENVSEKRARQEWQGRD